ncbi:unnamed protein product [Symbiodinium sp. CCMP2456]|nr:unnamed protein product [Symbiodinium sp. CCMP2456]
MWRTLMVMFPVHIVHALRTEVGDAESVDQRAYSLPRRCSNGLFSSSHCCSCSEINGQRLEPELGAVIDTCEWVTKDGVIHGKPCCAVWAVDCSEEEPQFQRGLNRDCIVTKEECADSECSDVYKELAAARHALAKAQRDRPQRKSWEEQGIVNGKSNSPWMCPCACGNIVDLDPKQMTCKSLNEKAIVCPSVRACCSDLVECDADAPWPKAVRNNTAEMGNVRSSSDERIKQLRGQVAILEGLSDECYDSCSIAHKKVCLNDLKAVVQSGILGKDVTQQEVDAQMQMTAMATSAATSRKARDKLIQDLNAEQRRKNHARDLERQRAWREKQLIKLASFRDRVYNAAVDSLRGEECCKCKMIEKNRISLLGKTTFVVDICSARACEAYKGMCTKLDKGFCSEYMFAGCWHGLSMHLSFAVLLSVSCVSFVVLAGPPKAPQLASLGGALARLRPLADALKLWPAAAYAKSDIHQTMDFRSDPHCAEGVSAEPTKMVGLTPQEVAFAEELLEHDADDTTSLLEEAPLELELTISPPGFLELQRLHEAVEADDVEPLQAAILQAQDAGVSAEEVAFAVAVCAQRKEQRKRQALEVLQKVSASCNGMSGIVKLRSALMLARAAGVSPEELRPAEDLRAVCEAKARQLLPSSLAIHRRDAGQPRPGQRLRWADEVGISSTVEFPELAMKRS